MDAPGTGQVGGAAVRSMGPGAHHLGLGFTGRENPPKLIYFGLQLSDPSELDVEIVQDFFKQLAAGVQLGDERIELGAADLAAMPAWYPDDLFGNEAVRQPIALH